MIVRDRTSEHENLKFADGRQVLVRNGFLPERTIQVPKIRESSGSGLYFNSQLVPPYLKRNIHG